VGRLILKSRHRLLCGDSTSPADVNRLMGGERADAAITDPPYSVNYDESHKQRGGNQHVHAAYHEADLDPTDLLTFMDIVPSDVMLWSYPIDRHFQKLAAAYHQFGWEFRKELIWAKDSFSFWMSAKYQQKHESIMWAVRKGKNLGGTMAANETTVFEYPRPKSHELHPTAKPVALWAKLVTNHVMKGMIVYEPFSGSGTTIVAAEQTSRRCYAIELEPQYCDVAVERWQNLTGEKAVRWEN
jgi:DNA modification methylase